MSPNLSGVVLRMTRWLLQVRSQKVVIRDPADHVLVVKREQVEEFLFIQVDLESSQKLPELDRVTRAVCCLVQSLQEGKET